MTTIFKRNPTSFLPSYSHNAVLQLIIASGVGYIAFLFTAVCFQAFGHFRFTDAVNLIRPYIALPSKESFLSHPWTVLTYGWSHYGFWEWASNMIWLYCFGGIVQMLIGYRQIIPMFIYSLVAGGIFYMLAQWIPGVREVSSATYVLGAQSGVTALAVAALSLSPKYRLYFSPTFSIPLPLLAGIFAALMLLRINMELPALMMVAGGGLMGFLYIRMLRSGYKPGDWMYAIQERIDRIFAPSEKAVWNHNKRRGEVLNRRYEPKQGISQRRIDELLDKILQKGYESLTKEEKDILMRASGENG